LRETREDVSSTPNCLDDKRVIRVRLQLAPQLDDDGVQAAIIGAPGAIEDPAAQIIP
jgi:hypothetical protein